MRLQPIIDRLQSAGFVTLGGIIEFAGLTQAPPAGRLPAAFVVPGSDQANRSERVGVTDQKVLHELSVVLLLNGNSRPGASAISEQLETLSKAVLERLVGWTPPDMSGALQFASGRLVRADAGVVAWAIGFTTTSHLRKV